MKFYDWGGGTPVPYAGLTSVDVTVKLYKDASTSAITLDSSAFVELGDGVYRIELNASQTSCTTGVINITNTVSPDIIADSQSFYTNTIISDFKAATYDGISQETINEMLIAFMSNKITVTVPATNTKLISYKDRAGTSEIFNVTVATLDGSRSSSGTIN